MTTTTVVAFLKKVAEDEGLRREFIELAAKHGIRITADELGEAELEKVAGGVLTGVYFPKISGVTPELINADKFVR